jgi:predicted nucleotidyltransferase
MNSTDALDTFRTAALKTLSIDPRIEAVLEAGAGATGRADRFSDLDLVLVVADSHYDSVLAEREALAYRLGPLLASFTGEHVGEPRLLICLYAVPEGDLLLHVDLKVVRRPDLAERVDDPRVLFDRDGACAGVLAGTSAVWPERAPQWFEDRAWVWLHYGAARAARGETFEAVDMIGFFRAWILGPMLATAAGLPQRGLRHIELIPGASEALATTLTEPTKESLRRALLASLELYVRLRQQQLPPIVRRNAEIAVKAYIGTVLQG